MIYEGKLYGKIGSRYIPLKMTSDDVHAQAAEIAAMREAIREVFNSFADEDSAWLLDDQQTAALAKLQPFLAHE